MWRELAHLDQVQAEHGCDVPIHVDGASGGFVAPFLHPDLEWDFRVPRVASINTSGHKYGLVYPGVGWVMWCTPDALPEDLIFRVNYLGGEMPTFALNFSRPGAQVAAQYYNFIRLGWQGYRHVQQTCQDIALHLSGELAKMGPFELLSDGSDLPVLAFRLTDPAGTGYSVFDLSERLRQRGWLVPAARPMSCCSTWIWATAARPSRTWPRSARPGRRCWSCRPRTGPARSATRSGPARSATCSRTRRRPRCARRLGR